MREYFNKCFDYIDSKKNAGEVFLATLKSEDSDFCRFNNALVRQLGSVKQDQLSLTIVQGEKRQCDLGTELSGDFNEDKIRLDSLLKKGRSLLGESSEDPYILFNTEVHSEDNIFDNRTPKTEEVVSNVVQMAHGHDFVGILANGTIANGFANSLGQRNWYENHSFNLDFSLYHHADKAVKGSYAGLSWNDNEFQQAFDRSRSQLEVMGKHSKKISAGKYRTYLAPSAIAEILDLLNWGSFSLKKVKTKQSSLCMLEEGKKKLATSFTLKENSKEGIAPHFDSKGFVKPEEVVLIKDGEYRSSLINARSSKEFNLETNGANEAEMLESTELGAGELDQADILEQLGTGLYVNNLWYMNFSDKHACRLTGMTRFATLWVEDGKIVAPVDVMRFDDCFYDMFGDKLLGLTKQRDMIISNMTYDHRDTSSQRLPGALIKDFNLTL